jgi:putative PIN family toxin of toxin-antitoxin system
MRNKKFVVDANIWVSYFLANNLLILISAVSINKITLFYCDELLIEIERVLNHPHLKKRAINIKKAFKIYTRNRNSS